MVLVLLTHVPHCEPGFTRAHTVQLFISLCCITLLPPSLTSSSRLSQGFQLTCPPTPERSIHHSASHQAMLTRDLNTVFILRDALERLQRPAQKGKRGSLRHRPSDAVTVHMGLGRVFQKLVLAFQDISVFIYRQKSVPPT